VNDLQSVRTAAASIELRSDNVERDGTNGNRARLGAYMKRSSNSICLTLFRNLAVSSALVGSAFFLSPSLAAQAPEKPAHPVTIDDDGTAHVPAQVVPQSAYLSPEGKAYVAQHLKDMVTPPPGGFMKPYLDRQKVIYPTQTQDTTMGGVHVVIYTPKEGIAPKNKDRVLIQLHGGGFSGCWPGCAELESMPIASLGRIKVVSVDYREGPKYKFPAGSEDVAAVYTEVLKSYRPENVGIYGCSAGGMLTGMALAWFQKHNLPTPGAAGIYCAGAGTPPGIAAMGGDAAYTSTPIGEARLSPPPGAAPAGNGRRMPGPSYLDGTDPNDPLVNQVASPEVLAKFPPTLVITGTRDMAMSAALYTHTQLSKAGVDAELHVWEGMFHGFFYNPDPPESKDAFDTMIKFFDTHLGRSRETKHR
jgi:epsilon-lactone hydrolase